MQPHPQHSPRGTDAWTATDLKPKKRGKKAAARPKAAKKSPAKQPVAKKKSPTVAKKKQSTTKSTAKKSPTKSSTRTTSATKAPRGASRAVAALERKVADLEQKLTELEPLRETVRLLTDKLAELSTLVADLKSSRDSFDDDEVVEDPCLRWLGDPSIQQHRGRHVAIHATRGVIASADAVSDVLASVRAQDVAPDDVCLAFVPAFPF
ncbi:DUF5678 domain-containing protein [Nannocystis sp. SCPEA4]|uniref:DUF5678 domain-containing protein n=1 Tax=Nannocystis sp. SCPEA4 TaxID=2996787 RepID=UPI00227021E0|nr:DUF5678 domain-containing protein [Nannocystis sp. SCPEA4]MCY1057375.1 DUF5678 domain-containing protein [Nannocystis sp. SCPEA4]